MAWKKLLSKREVEVGEMVSLGFSNEKIGEEMSISFHTVKAHLRNIYSKTGFKGRTELIIKILK